MKLYTKNTFNFSISHQLQRLMIVFIFLSFTFYTYAGSGAKAKVTVNTTTNSTGRGDIYIDDKITNEAEKSVENSPYNATFKLQATPHSHNIFMGWYTNNAGTGDPSSTQNPYSTTLKATKENKNPSETYYAYFFFPKVSNLTVTSKQDCQFTIEWDAPQMPNGYTITKYYIHLYKNPTTTNNFVRNYECTETQLTINDLIDAGQYDVHVGVEFEDNEGTLVTQNDWGSDDNWVHLTNIPVTAPPFDGVKQIQGEWYRVMVNNAQNITNTTYNFSLLDYPCSNLKYSGYLNERATQEHTITVTGSPTNEEYDKKDLQDQANDYVYTSEDIKINITETSLNFKGARGFSAYKDIYINNIYAKIAPHILLKPLKTNTLETEIGTAKSLPLNVNFKSFLAMGNMTITSSDPQFLIDGNQQNKTIECGANYLCKTDNTEHNFSVVYMPTSVGTHTATITITDGTSTETIKLTGICKKNTPTITWVANKQLVYGTNLANAASSDCGTAITYTSADEEIIKIVNNELVPVGLGTTTITATTAGNDKYESINSTAEFEVVDKDIQIVVWEQDFYLLKLTDDDITLNAYTKDKETGEPNNLPIEYSSANTNIVTVNDGALHIVGKGQTSITAYQRGNDQYAGTYMTKTVIVREVSDDCSSSYAFDVPALVEKGDDSFLGGFTTNQIKETHNLNTIGDKLSFRTTCNNASISHSIRVTDQSDNLIYDGDFGEVNDIPLSRDVTSLNFFVQANFRITLSDIIVTQATYLEAIDKTVSFQTQYGATGNTSIYFNWANQPDFIWAKIIDDASGVFSIADGTNITTATCGTYGTDFVNIKFKPTAAGNYTAKLVLGVGESEEIKETIDITATAHKGYQAITWTDALTTADRQVQIAESDKNIDLLYEIINGTGAEITNNGSRISVIEANTFTVRAYNEGSNNYHPISAEKEFTSTIGTIRLDNNGNWNTTTNWLPVSTLNTQRNVEPSANVNGVIMAEAVMNNVNGEINNLTFETNGKLTIGATSSLKANEVTNATADNLILKASVNGNATFIYNSGTPSATVEMYSKATGAVNNGTPQWQYMGVAVNNATTSDFQDAWLLKWTEADNVTGDPWSDAPLAPETTLAPWAGYSISQPQAETYTMKGALMNGNHTYTLTRTESTDPDCGFNLLANSYTAPIDITKLTTSDFVNADACIILYNTGTYADWESQQGQSGEASGQLTVIPIETVGATDLPKTIPSMQAFFVMAQKDGATFTVNYENAVANTDRHSNQMRAPRAENEFNVLKIMIEGENTRDRLYLLENEETSKAYDNGYEARKIFDAPRGHQMYATCEYGYASIDCSESFVGQTIGLKGDNEGEMLTISFDIDRLEGYESLYLYDKVTGRYVNIVAGEKYTFFGVKEADDNRFSIVTNPDDRNQTPPFVVIGEELAFDKSQINADNANIYIYDTSGRLLMTDKINPHENYNIPNMPKGIYLISMNGYTTKIVKK